MSKLPTARPALGLLALLAAAVLGLAGAGSAPDLDTAGGGRTLAVNNTGSDYTPPGPIM
ncbi:hypothetical protein [Streptomyces vinaceus]|uniref:hypothetical protein n=1 Tax=Streptomyces vinaceus TaxID=1960 RepID=UPI0010CFADCD|nr:hypothetical protein [Streptomyces vinaceus]GHE44588.1 hypothetical protein GCM10017778_30060 [Streptomyces vinaceus]